MSTAAAANTTLHLHSPPPAASPSASPRVDQPHHPISGEETTRTHQSYSSNTLYFITPAESCVTNKALTIEVQVKIKQRSGNIEDESAGDNGTLALDSESVSLLRSIALPVKFSARPVEKKTNQYTHCKQVHAVADAVDDPPSSSVITDSVVSSSSTMVTEPIDSDTRGDGGQPTESDINTNATDHDSSTVLDALLPHLFAVYAPVDRSDGRMGFMTRVVTKGGASPARPKQRYILLESSCPYSVRLESKLDKSITSEFDIAIVSMQIRSWRGDTAPVPLYPTLSSACASVVSSDSVRRQSLGHRRSGTGSGVDIFIKHAQSTPTKGNNNIDKKTDDKRVQHKNTLVRTSRKRPRSSVATPVSADSMAEGESTTKKVRVTKPDRTIVGPLSPSRPPVARRRLVDTEPVRRGRSLAVLMTAILDMENQQGNKKIKVEEETNDQDKKHKQVDGAISTTSIPQPLNHASTSLGDVTTPRVSSKRADDRDVTSGGTDTPARTQPFLDRVPSSKRRRRPFSSRARASRPSASKPPHAPIIRGDLAKSKSQRQQQPTDSLIDDADATSLADLHHIRQDANNWPADSDDESAFTDESYADTTNRAHQRLYAYNVVQTTTATQPAYPFNGGIGVTASNVASYDPSFMCRFSPSDVFAWHHSGVSASASSVASIRTSHPTSAGVSACMQMYPPPILTPIQLQPATSPTQGTPQGGSTYAHANAHAQAAHHAPLTRIAAHMPHDPCRVQLIPAMPPSSSSSSSSRTPTFTLPCTWRTPTPTPTPFMPLHTLSHSASPFVSPSTSPLQAMAHTPAAGAGHCQLLHRQSPIGASTNATSDIMPALQPSFTRLLHAPHLARPFHLVDSHSSDLLPSLHMPIATAPSISPPIHHIDATHLHAHTPLHAYPHTFNTHELYNNINTCNTRTKGVQSPTVQTQ